MKKKVRKGPLKMEKTERAKERRWLRLMQFQMKRGKRKGRRRWRKLRRKLMKLEFD
jgi:hypothetical protein